MQPTSGLQLLCWRAVTAGAAALPCNSHVKNVTLSDSVWHNRDPGAREESPDLTQHSWQAQSAQRNRQDRKDLPGLDRLAVVSWGSERQLCRGKLSINLWKCCLRVGMK